MSTKIVLNDKFDPSVAPAYVDYFDYWWWGFKGQRSVNLQKACVDQKPYAVQRIKSVEDGFITAFTLGIYTPQTVRVWCGE